MPIIQTSSLPNQLNELALFAGAGGGILGGKLLGWRTVCAVEWDAYARDVLVARQNDGCLYPFPIWDDIQTFDGRPWRGCVDVVSGGFPCQDISSAGKGAGIKGERSGMWKHMARIIGEVRPRFVLVENSPMLVGRGLGLVVGDLAALGYDAKWGIVGAHHTGAPHKRDRIWIVADASGGRCSGPKGGKMEQPRRTKAISTSEVVAYSMHKGLEGFREKFDELSSKKRWQNENGQIALCGHDVGNSDCLSGRGGAGGKDGQKASDSSWWGAEPNVGRVAHGVAARVDRLRCIGNGQVPAVVPLAWSVCGDDEAADGKHERLACNNQAQTTPETKP